MHRTTAEPPRYERTYAERHEAPVEAPAAWPVRWHAIWVGGLVALTAAAVLGLVASAIGDADASAHLTSWATFTHGALIYSIFSSLLAFFLGGFIAAKVAGVTRFEPAILHGALTWLVVFPVLLLLGAVGAGHFFGNFATGLIGPPAWIVPAAGNVTVDPVAAYATKNIATAALFTILLGLLGGMLGGWLASDEVHIGRRRGHTNETRTVTSDRVERRYGR